MQEITVDSLKILASEITQASHKWHFHILTPACKLNEKPRHAFVLEDVTAGQSYVSYSDQPEKSLAVELAPLISGPKILDQTTTDADYKPSQETADMLKQSGTNIAGTEWHHHMLFPDCRYNHHAPKYVLLFEDTTLNENIEMFSDAEPTSDLRKLETDFYASES
ncbi:MAG: hypothetical protein ABI220_03225 [Candidatus Saccharimonadales bacterium]